VLEQEVGELRDREDVDQVEEQLDGLDPVLAVGPGPQYPGTLGDPA
jgi:hypothetical protein